MNRNAVSPASRFPSPAPAGIFSRIGSASARVREIMDLVASRTSEGEINARVGRVQFDRPQHDIVLR